jgi:hypothetical protein
MKSLAQPSVAAAGLSQAVAGNLLGAGPHAGDRRQQRPRLPGAEGRPCPIHDRLLAALGSAWERWIGPAGQAGSPAAPLRLELLDEAGSV